MADQLTALQIKIEADIKSAIDQLNTLASTIKTVETTVETSVGNISRLLKSIDSKVVNIGVKVSGAEQLQNFSKKAAGAVGSNPLGVGIDTSSIDAFVARVKAGVQTSIEELKNFRKATAQLYEQKRLKLGVDDTEVVELRKKLEFINGFIQSAQRQVKVRISSEGDQELRNKLNGLQKEYVLQIIPTFNDAEFNKLLEEVQNKRININFNDIEAELSQRIQKLEQKKTLLPIGINNAQIDAELATLNTRLASVKTLRIAANTTPAEQALSETIRKVNTELAKQRELKLKAQITLPNAELAALTSTKKRLEADKIKLKGTAEVGNIVTNLEAVKARINELNRQGVKLQVTTGEFISQKSIAGVEKTLALVKDLKKQGGSLRIDIQSSGLSAVNAQASQTIRNFEQIIRDSPSFAISAQQGFIAISNNIGPLTDSFGRLAAEAKASGQGIGAALKNALTGWNGIGIAISLAVTAVAIFGKELFGASEKTKKLKDEIEELNQKLKDTASINPLAAASEEGNITQIKLLTQVVGDLSQSETVRSNALETLKGINDAVYGKFSIYSLNTDQLTEATNKLTKSLIAEAIVRSKIDKISNLSQDREIVKARKDAAAVTRDLAKQELDLAAKRLNANTNPGLGASLSAQFISAKKKYDESVENYKKLAIQNIKEVSVIEGLKFELDKDVAEALKSLTVDPTKSSTTAAEDDTLKKILESRRETLQAELENTSNLSRRYFTILSEIASLDLQIKNIGETIPEVKSNNFKQYQEALKGIGVQAEAAGIELFNLKAQLADPQFFTAPNIEPFVKLREEVIKSQEVIDELFRSGELTTAQKLEAEVGLKLDTENEILKLQKELDSRQLLINTGIAPQLEPVIPDQSITPLPEMANEAQMLKDMTYAVEDWNQKLLNSLKPMEEFQKRMEALNKEIANIVASGLSELFNNLFDGLAEDGVLTFEEISKAINQFVQDLIKATARLLIFKAIAAAFGISDGPTGLLGSIVRPRKFATGGIITGPTFGMVGESGTEAVLPLSYLSNLIGGTGQSTPSLALRGSDLYWIWSQENRKNNRYF